MRRTKEKGVKELYRRLRWHKNIYSHELVIFFFVLLALDRNIPIIFCSTKLIFRMDSLVVKRLSQDPVSVKINYE